MLNIGKLSACVAVISVTGLCALCTPAEDEPLQMLTGRPRDESASQVVVQVHVIGVREDVNLYEGPSFPAPGVTFAEARLAGVSATGTAAGIEMTGSALSAWLKKLAETKRGGLLATPRLSAELGRETRAANSRRMQYVANWQFDENGLGSVVRAELTPGMTVKVQPTGTSDADTALLKLDLELVGGELRDFAVADRLQLPGGGKVLALKLQLPVEQVLRLSTTVPVRHGNPTILAHYFRQYRHSGSGATVSAIREHTLCVVTITPAAEASQAKPFVGRAAMRRLSACLFWSVGHAEMTAEVHESGNRPAQDTVRFSKIDTSELRRMFDDLAAEAGVVCHTLGIALGTDQSATFEVGRVVGYVSGISSEPVGETAGSRGFVIKEARDGARLTATVRSAKDKLVVGLKGSVRGPGQFDSVTKTLPSLRAPVKSGVVEKYHFNVSRQTVAELDSELGTATGEIWRLDLPWEHERDGEPPKPVGQGGRVVLFVVRDLPASP